MLKSKIAIAFFSIFLFVDVIQIHAIENPVKVYKLGVKDAVQLGILKSEALELKNNEIQNYELKYKETRSGLYPSIKAMGTYQRYFEYPSKLDYEKSLQITLNQLVYSFGKVENALIAADKLKDITYLSKTNTSLEITYKIKKAYLNTLLAQELLNITKESYNNANKNKNLLLKSFAYGRVNQRDNLKMDTDIASRVPALKQAEANLMLAKNALKRLLRIEEWQDIVLTDGFTKNFGHFDVTKLLNEMYFEQVNLKILQKNIDLKESLAKLEKANKYPVISAFAGFGYAMNDNEVFFNKLDYYQQLSYIGINVSVPLYEGGKYKHRYDEANLEIDNQKIILERAKLDLKLAFENEILNYQSLLEIYRSNLKTLELAERSFSLSQEKFSFGKLGLLDLNDAELMLTNVRTSVVTTLFKINISLVEIDELLSRQGV